MPRDPTIKRVTAFVDGQNLFHAAREAFGYSYPNYDPPALAQAVCQAKRWSLDQTYFSKLRAQPHYSRMRRFPLRTAGPDDFA